MTAFEWKTFFVWRVTYICIHVTQAQFLPTSSKHVSPGMQFLGLGIGGLSHQSCMSLHIGTNNIVGGSMTYPYPKIAIWLWSPLDSRCQHRNRFDLWATHPGNLIPVLGRPDTLTQPLLRAPNPGITSQPQPASQLNRGTQLTSRGQTWHRTHVVACSLNFTSYNLKYITDHSAEQQYFQH